MPIADSINQAAPGVVGRRRSLRKRTALLGNQGLWLIVATVFLCSALAVGLNTNLNVTNNFAAKAATADAQDGGRIFNDAAILACFVGLLVALCQPGWYNRIWRVFGSPIGWAAGYQAIIAWHYASDENYWDMARLCGVWLLLIVAMAASPKMAVDRYASKILLLFRLLLWTSVVIGVVLPNNGWQHDFVDTFIPGVTDRFAGVGGHANGMGAIAGIAVLFELNCILGSSGRWLSLLHLSLGSVLLILTQSKTSLMACVLCSLYLVLSRKKGGLPAQIRIVMVAGAVLVGTLFAWSFLGDWVVSNENNLGDLTGRLPLWQYLWDVAVQQPWFGFGRSLWEQLTVSDSFKYKWAAGNAHNQLLNSFLMAGAVGVVCLIGYVVALFLRRRSIEPGFRALFTACLLFMVIRAFVEAGFEPGDLWLVGHIQTVLIGFCFCRRAKRTAATAGWVQSARRVRAGDIVVPIA